jgi:hypothetical protein
VKGFVDEIAIICGASEIARHPRVYGRGQFVFELGETQKEADMIKTFAARRLSRGDVPGLMPRSARG